MSAFRNGIFGVLGVAIAGLALAAALYPPRAATTFPQAIFAPDIETSAGGRPENADTKYSRYRMGPPTVASLEADFDALGFDLERVGLGSADVPRVFFTSLPVDIGGLRDTEARKSLFLKIVLPLVLSANEDILEDRERLWDLKYRTRLGERSSAVDRLWLKIMSERYRVTFGDLEELARRMDVVPPSMALAQAAEGSAWGTSKSVRQDNAIFGKRFQAVADHKEQSSGRLHASQPAFNSLFDSVSAYFLALNTQPAYAAFRQSREEMRRQGRPLTGRDLISHLQSYSEQDDAYLEVLSEIIEVNGLGALDDARLQFSTAKSAPSS